MAHYHLTTRLDELERDGLLRRRLTLEGAQGAHVSVDGREYLAFCSNDYLGLANHPRLIEAAIEGLRRHGVGSGASHLVTGHNIAHERLEKKLADYVQLPRALLFSTGYQANIGAITALAGRESAVFSDKLNHASLIDGVRLSRAEAVRYPHGDMAFLEQALAKSTARQRMIVTDSVFSMDGDVAPLPALLDLAERYDALLLVDDAHGFGVLGPQGRGALAHFGLRSPRLVYVGTLGKAAGVSGAFVAGAPDVVETVLQRARTYIFTTASPPHLATALEASLELMQAEEWRRERLRELVVALRSGMRGSNLQPSDTPVQALVVGGNTEALALSDAIRDRGILVPAIRPPTVPEGTARLRISLSAAHELADVSRLVDALRDALPDTPSLATGT